jgi:hypothetical protein
MDVARDTEGFVLKFQRLLFWRRIREGGEHTGEYLCLIASFSNVLCPAKW